MKYPGFWRKTINAIAFVAANMVLLISLLSVLEAVLRYIFKSPTHWSLDVSRYALIWAMFLGSSYAFQEHGHVSVDMLLNIVDKTGTRVPRKIMSVIGYLMSFLFISSILYGGVLMIQKSVKYNRMTSAAMPIPQMYLELAIIVGCALMLITLIFIILDIFSNSETYI